MAIKKLVFKKYTPDALSNYVNKYFTEREREEWNIPDLCDYLNITTVTFYSYRQSDDMRDICQRAIDRICAKREAALDNGRGSSAGIVFLLKASGYKDETTVNQNISGSIDQHLDLSLEEMLADSDDDFQA